MGKQNLLQEVDNKLFSLNSVLIEGYKEQARSIYRTLSEIKKMELNIMSNYSEDDENY